MGNTLQKLPQFSQHRELQLRGQTNHQQSSEFEDDGNREFTCEICIEPASKRFRNAGRCSHPFCTDCVVKYIRAKLDDGAGDIMCPGLGCGHSLDPTACTEVVGTDLFVRWCDALCEAAILGAERCYCPYRNCNVLIVNECGGIVRKSKCPSCKRPLCFQCKRVWHAGFGCDESGEARDRNDVAFGRLAEQNKWKRCPRCRHFVELLEGCRIVKCRCGISFCYKCGKQVEQHWCRCDRTSLCCEWCFRVSILVIFLTFAFFFFTWGQSLRNNTPT
ncbi:E3 ubiquitin-protein ligase RSL1-like [Salvia miltiorrhiza]|uniref:E3 ubiquitin-protein ligase RSL1-like n=1 Tax=Salvia miltiorrhiza TaxID=226208 RepID=UPI0025AD4D29|nr:E3 ubiquitin-protein ligase RSL1-like [Salvia miltiorrhiza]